MQALIFDPAATPWESSQGFTKADIPAPILNEATTPADADYVIIHVRYAGVCGSDRGIWTRQAFREQILGSLAAEQKQYRVLGHEFFGEIVSVGSRVTNVAVGDAVSCESHVVCNACYQCVRGEKHVCTNEKILGISHDGGFAEFAKVPAHIVWKTDLSKIRPEIAAVQEPFGNAVHAASKVDLKDKTVAIFGLGPIGQFLALVVKGMGASKIIAVEPNPVAREMGRKLGIDHVLSVSGNPPSPLNSPNPFAHDAAVTDEIMRLTDDIGVDVSFEMAGFNSSVNNCLFATRRGGDVILFGIKTGDFVLEDYNRLIVRGLTLHAVIGRQVFETWETTKKLLEDTSNGIQAKLFDVILNGGDDTIVRLADYDNATFAAKMASHPKILLQIS